MALREKLNRSTRPTVTRWFLNFLRYRLSPSGKAFLAMWIVSGYLATTSSLSPIFIVWAFVTVTLAGSEILSRVALPKIKASRRPILPVCVGEDLTVDVELENTTKRHAHDVRAMEFNLPEHVRIVKDHEAVLIDRLPPGESRSVPLKFHCSKRGYYTLANLNAASSFPLGIYRALRPSSQLASFLVYPAFKTPESFSVPEGRQYQPGGFLLSSNVGDSAEFMHTREYREGDNPRHIHWASWARTGEPVVKVFHEEYFVRMALLLDSEVPTRKGDEAFESGISTAAGVADYLSRRDYIIDIFAAGPKIYHFQAGRALAHFENILEIMACLESTPKVDWARLEEAILPEAPRLTAVIAILMDWSPERRELIDTLKGIGVATRVLVVKDGDLSLRAPEEPRETFLHLTPGESLESGGL